MSQYTHKYTRFSSSGNSYILPFPQVPLNLSVFGNAFNNFQLVNRSTQRRLEVDMFDSSASNSCLDCFGKKGHPNVAGVKCACESVTGLFNGGRRRTYDLSLGTQDLTRVRTHGGVEAYIELLAVHRPCGVEELHPHLGGCTFESPLLLRWKGLLSGSFLSVLVVN